jgi:hypothetical protein
VVGHVVIHDESLVAAGVETAEAQQVLVPDTAEDLHLDGELHLRLGRHRLQPLHRDLNTTCTNQKPLNISQGMMRRPAGGGNKRTTACKTGNTAMDGSCASTSTPLEVRPQ